MELSVIAAELLKRIEQTDPLKCPTCGATLELSLVGKVNPVYVARCPSVTVPHPTWICTPTIHIET